MNHKASWPQNAVVFFMPTNTASSITWSFTSEPFLMDFDMQEAALAQLESAYGLPVTFPDTERRILSLMGMSDQDIEDGKELYFSWEPPLPQRASKDNGSQNHIEVASALNTVARLFSDGLLSEDEFLIAKKKILE